jgi:hypothetical protein
LVLIWLNKAVKFLSILINTLCTHWCSAFTKDLPVIKIVLLIFVVLCVLLVCVLTFWVPCCDFRIQTMVGSSLPPVVCKRAHVLLWYCFDNYFTYFVPVFKYYYSDSGTFERNESGRFGALKSDSTHHFFRNACTKSGLLRFSQFSGCWLILSVYIIMSFDFPFVRLFGVR